MNYRTCLAWTATFFPAVAIVGIVAHSTKLFAQHGFLDRFQTLIAGLVAILAAFIGGAFVNRQIAASEQQERKRAERQHVAIRAVLPLSLSQIGSYCRDVGRSLKLVYDAHGTRGDRGVAPLPEFPSVQREWVSELRDMIVVAEPALTDSIATLLTELQVQVARIGGLRNDLLGTEAGFLNNASLSTLIVDNAEIYARAMDILEYARREITDVSPDLSFEDVRSALNQTGFRGDGYAEVRAEAERRMSRATVSQ